MSFISTFKSHNIIGATLLVTGCCIGAGMIGLPVISALAGFMPTSLAMFLCYVFTTLTGLLLLEATLWFDKKVNLLSIVEFTLGRIGKSITGILFLFLFYCLFVAYLDGGGQLFTDILSTIFQYPVSNKIGIITCAGFVAVIAYAGTKVVDHLNRYLLVGLIVSYCVLVLAGLPRVEANHLTHINWEATIATVPILLICFGYQNLVPSLVEYLNKNVNGLRFAIIVGNFIPFLIYLLWNFVILGMLPESSLNAKHNPEMISELLQGANDFFSIVIYMKAFSLFAILTSFLPNTISFVDFLKDGLSCTVEKKSKFELLLYGIIFIPPLLCALFYPHIFLQALSFAGGFIDVLLFGVLPAIVIIIGRNFKKIIGPYQVIGGNVTPISILLLSLLVLLLRFK